MDIGTLINIALTVLTSLVVSWAIISPLLELPAGEVALTSAEEVSVRQDQRREIFAELEELEIEFRSGKLDSEDYQQSRDELFQKAAAVIAEGDNETTPHRREA